MSTIPADLEWIRHRHDSWHARTRAPTRLVERMVARVELPPVPGVQPGGIRRERRWRTARGQQSLWCGIGNPNAQKPIRSHRYGMRRIG
jgi:hypothetical protein